MMPQRLWLRLQHGLPNTLLFTGGIALAGFMSGLILARVLGPEGRGQFATVVLWPTVLATFGELGLGFTLAYFAGKSRESIDGLWTLAWVASLLVGGMVSLAGLMILPSQLTLTGMALAALQWNMITVPVMMLSGFLAYLLLGSGYLFEFNLVRACSAICYTFGIVGVVVVGLSGINTFTAVFVIAQCASCGLAIVFVFFRLHPAWRWQPQLIKPVFKYATKTYASGLMAQANLRLDQLIMTIVISPIQLGLYVVAVAVSGIASPLYNAVAIVVLPRVIRSANRLIGGYEAIRHMKIMFFSGVPITVVLCILMPWILPVLFGNEYQLSILPAQILLVAAFFQGGVIVLGHSLRGLEYPGRTTISEGVGLLLTIILLFALLPILGILGAAIASLVAYMMVAFMQLYFIINVSGIKWSDLCCSRHMHNLSD